MAVVQFKTSTGKHLTINARDESTVVMQDFNLSYSFDSAGRLIGAFREGRNYRRSLGNEILEKYSGARLGLAGRVRRMLTPAQVRSLEADAYEFARGVAQELRQPGLDGNPGAVETARAALARIIQYSYTSLERERELYKHIYHPVTILPPDQYLALYLQMTEGCAFNRCAFCGFYRDRRFRIKPLGVFREHIYRVRAFMGDGLRLRHSIFLGDANALVIAQKILLPRFDLINQEFSIVPRHLTREQAKAWRAAHPTHFDGIYSFLDACSTKSKQAKDYQALAERGLRRVYIGLESGDAELLKFLRKPNTPDDVVRAVNEVKAGGVAVGIVILVGAGGAQFARAHVEHTTRLVSGLPLDGNDLIYLSELVEVPGSTYAALAAQAGIRPLSAQRMEQQARALRAGLDLPSPPHGPRISLYDIREFVY